MMSSSDLKDKNERKPSFLVYLAVVVVQMSSVSLGCSLGWSGPALADMARNDSHPQLTDKDEDKNMKTWVASSMTIGALFGGILCGFCIEFLGYKKSMIFLGIPFSIGWVLLGFGRKIWILIIGRIITGLCSGIALGIVPAYVTDISTPNIRGMLGMAMNLFGVIGILYFDILLLWIPWNYTSLAAIIPSIILSVSIVFMPESPNWLMAKFGRGPRVVEVMHRLRRPESDIEQELNEIEEFILSRRAQNKQNFDYRMLLRQDLYKPMLIAICLQFFAQFSGMNALQFYMADIFKDSGSSIDPSYAVIIVNTVMLLATVLGGVIVDKLGRKILLMISGLFHTISTGTLGYYYFKHRNDSPLLVPISSNITTTISSIYFSSVPVERETSALPIICLVVFVIGFSLGYGPVTWIVITEICNGNVVGFVVSFSSFICWVFTFIVTKEFEDIKVVAQKYGTFWIFCGVSALSILFASYLPETKGKTVEEIQKILYPKVYINNNNNRKSIENQFARTEVSA